MSKSTTVIGVILGAVALGGCLLTTSLDGLVGGAEEPSMDGSAAVRDGAAQADPVEGGPSSGFCATAPRTLLACADFDNGVFPFPFQLSTRGPGSAAVAGDDARSLPLAVLFTSGITNDVAGAALWRGLPSGAKAVTIELDMKVEQRGTPDYDVVTVSGGGAEVGFEIRPDGTFTFDEQYRVANGAGETGGKTDTNIASPSDWFHVTFTSVATGPTAVATLSIDGKVVGTRTCAADAFLAASPRLAVGDEAQHSVTEAWRVRMDNITVDAR